MTSAEPPASRYLGRDDGTPEAHDVLIGLEKRADAVDVLEARAS